MVSKKKKINKKILIIEDDKDFLFILEKRFTTEGFSVVSAQDGEEALTVIEEEKPDLIISDVLLPKMDGISLVEKLKEVGTNPPVIFLTNVKDPNYLTRIKELGNADYFIKCDLQINDIIEKTKKELNIKP